MGERFQPRFIDLSAAFEAVAISSILNSVQGLTNLAYLHNGRIAQAFQNLIIFKFRGPLFHIGIKWLAQLGVDFLGLIHKFIETRFQFFLRCL